MYTEHIWTTDQLGLVRQTVLLHNVTCTGHMYRQGLRSIAIASDHTVATDIVDVPGCALSACGSRVTLRLTGSVSYSRSTRALNHLHRDTTLAFGVAKHRPSPGRNALRSVCI
jgi:hypothetical protein